MYAKRVLSVIIAIVLIAGTMPAVVVGASGYSSDAVTDLFGNISYGKSVTFDITVTSPETEEIVLINKVVDEYGVVKAEDRRTVSVSGNAKATTEVTLDTGAFGVFELKTYMYSDNTLVHTDTTDFSVVKTTDKVNDEVGIHMLFNNDSDHKRYLQEITELYDKCGFSTVREGWPWREVERTAGSFKLNTLMKNQLMLLTQNPQKDVLLTLGYGHSKYTGGDATPPTTESALKAWYDYCYNLASLTKGSPVNFEVYNEYDRVGTTAEYYNILKNAYTAVKAANPQAKVYGMVTSWTAEWWISEVLEMGGGSYLDGVSVHPYAWSQSPEEFGSMDGIASVRNLMNRYGLNNKELIVSEIGWYKFVGRENQASYHVRFLALNKVYDLLDKTIYFRYTRSLATDNNEEFGFIENANADVPFSAFPVFPAMVNYNDIMTDAVYQKTVADNTYMYKLSNGKSCIMMWNDDAKTLSLDLGVNSVVLTDMYGNEQTVFGTDGKYTFIASSNISYITGDFNDAKTCEAIVAPDKSVACNYTNGYAVTEIMHSGGKRADILSSENVIAYTRENSEGNIEIVTACRENDKGYVYINVYDGNKCVFSGREHIQGRSGDHAVVYDSDFDDFDLSYFYGIGIEEIDGEEVICASVTNDDEQERAIVSRTLRKSSGNAVSISMDVRFSGNTDLCIKAEGDTGAVQLFRALNEGRFAYGANGDYEKNIGYEANKWYNVECILNLVAKTAYYYVDGEFLGDAVNVAFPAEIEKVSVPIHTESQIKTYIKDFRIKRYSAGSLVIENAVAAADNSYVDVSFSGALKPDTDLSLFGICDINSGKTLDLKKTEKITASDYRIIPMEPLCPGGLYAVTVDGKLYGAENIVFDGNEFVFNAGNTDNIPKVLGVYSVKDKMRTRINGFTEDGDILIELSDSVDKQGEVKLSCKDKIVSLPYYCSEDGRYIIASPNGEIENGKSYSLGISGFEDKCGNRLEANLRFTASDRYKYGTENLSGMAQADGYEELFADGFENYNIMAAEYPADIYSFTGDKWSWASNIGGPWQGLGAQVVPANGGKALKLVNWGTDRIAASKLIANIGRNLNSGVVDVYFDAAVYNPEENEALNYLEIYLCGGKNMPVMKIFGDKVRGYINGGWVDIELAKNKINDINEFGKYRITFDFDNGEMSIAAFDKCEYRILMRTKMLGGEGASILQNGFEKVMFFQYRHNDSTAQLSNETAGIVDNVSVCKKIESNKLRVLKNGNGVLSGEISKGDTLTFRAEINNRDAAEKHYIMFIGYYSNGRLVKVEKNDIDIMKNESGIIVKDFESTVPEDGDISVKCMLFDGNGIINPEAKMIRR